MDPKDARTLHRVFLRYCKTSILAKGELSNFAEASKMKAAEDNLETLNTINDSIMIKNQVQSLIQPIDACQIYEMGLEEYRWSTFGSVVQVSRVLAFLECFFIFINKAYDAVCPLSQLFYEI